MIMKFKYLIYCACAALCSALPLHAEENAEAANLLKSGIAAMNGYDFKTAQTNLEKYKSIIKKEGADPDYRADELLSAIPMAEDMLAGRVQKIVIIDSISVPKKDFLRAYRLAAPSGSLTTPVDLNDMGEAWCEMKPSDVTYNSEDGSVRYIGIESESIDETDGSIEEISRIYESFRLDDGSWSEPVALFDEDTDAAYPFMLSDGCTFYFASRSEQGLGGYDLFRSYRDSETGEFQNPVNMGLPYNSPANDYMLAIDEYTGAGWWATDRNSTIGDNGEELVTIYVFLPAEVRENYDADTPNLKNFAALWTLHFPQEHALHEEDAAIPSDTASKVPGWKLTWPDNADFSHILNAIQSISRTPPGETPDFYFIADGGKVFTNYSELPRAACSPMQYYLEIQEKCDNEEAILASLRKRYSEMPSESSKNLIDAQQQRVEELRNNVLEARNRLYTSLRNNK